MKQEDFKLWFMENLEFMSTLGIMHYNADRAKDIHCFLTVMNHYYKDLIDQLEAVGDDMEYVVKENKQLKARVDQLQETIEKLNRVTITNKPSKASTKTPQTA